MRPRLLMIGGALGAASLALVGVGAHAGFTSDVVGTATVSSGTFALNAYNTAVSTSGPLAFDANNYKANAGSLTVTPVPTGSAAGTAPTLTYTLPNVAPGDNYFASFSVDDVGTLQGQVNSIAFTPGTDASAGQQALAGQLTVKVFGCEQGSCKPGTETGWSLLGTTTASAAKTFSTSGYTGTYPNGNYFGPNFLQPNANGQQNGQDEASVQYQIEYSMPDTTASQNAAEGVTLDAATFSVQGVNTP